MDHGREIAQNVIEGYMPDAEGDPNPVARERIAQALNKLESEIREHRVSPEQYANIMSRVESFQKEVGYTNGYAAWIENHLPKRLESMLGSHH